MRIRSHLLLLATVALVPGFFAAAIAIDKVRQGERNAALRGLHETVRATTLLVDGEIQRSLGALNALANSPHLQNGNFEAFYEQAKAIDQPPDVWTLLLDETGTQRVNTAVPFGSPAPPAVARQRVAKVLASQQPLFTDVFVGPVTGRLVTTIYVAAEPSPMGRFVVAQTFSVDHWKKRAMRPQGQADWVVAVIDRQGNFIARSHLTKELVGRAARPELVAAAAASQAGLIRHATLEGVDAYDAFAHSALTGWTIAVAAPVDTIEASANQSIAWLATGFTVALLAALGGASMINRRLIDAMDSAAAAARILGSGGQPQPLRTSLDEVNALGGALSDASRLLSAEQEARATVEAQRSLLLDRERAARETAQRDNTAKDQFLALLAHELRNPLAAISGATELVARRLKGDTANQRMIEIVQRQNRHMQQIVDDLLDVGRMFLGKVVLDTRPLDLADCVRHCIEALRTTQRAAGFQLTLQADDAWVYGDPVRLEQMVNNLVTNALKFSPPASEVLIRVRAAGERVVIEVEDRGAGIAAELMPRIFEPFVQGPALAGRQASGLGIGLALVKQLVELHGGEIHATSAGAGHGATFTVGLPRIAAPASLAAERPALLATACRVLLVEDNADARETMGELLRFLGYKVTETGDGDAVLRIAEAFRPDVVITDLAMPGKTGYEVAADLQATATLRHIPLIALSGYGQNRDIAASLTAGFCAHLVKPVQPDALMQAIENCLLQRATG